jgi:hypothetical protein
MLYKGRYKKQQTNYKQNVLYANKIGAYQTSLKKQKKTRILKGTHVFPLNYESSISEAERKARWIIRLNF